MLNVSVDRLDIIADTKFDPRLVIVADLYKGIWVGLLIIFIRNWSCQDEELHRLLGLGTCGHR